jgi:hypothetical protein
LILIGCSATRLSKIIAEVEQNKKTMVILRTTLEIDGEQVEPPFGSGGRGGCISIGIGGFETGGKLIFHHLNIDYFQDPVFHYQISAETLKKGWTFLLLEPGIYYFSIAIFGRKQDPYPSWRFDIPIGDLNLEIFHS